MILCDKCDKIFRDKYNLKKHKLIIHTGLKDMLEKAKSTLDPRTNDGQFLCRYCEKSFISKGLFFSDHSALTNRPDAKTQLSLIFFFFKDLGF